MTSIYLFLIGVAVGSFLNVLATRYKEDGWIFSADILKGRSHCVTCGKVLRWYELIPIVSFVIQSGRCRHCHVKLSWQYPAMEIIGGLVFVTVPMYTGAAPIWVLAVLTLILISLIDFRLYIIPDQLNWFLILLGLGEVVGKGATLFSSWQDQLFGLAFGFFVFLAIIALTRGKGMGLGDLKLGAALGFLFGWPKIILIIMLAFVIGGVAAVFSLIFKKKSWKDALPFGPFLAAAAVLALFFGNSIINAYGGYFQIFF